MKKLTLTLFTLFLVSFFLNGQTIPRVSGSLYPFSTPPNKLYIVADNLDVPRRVMLQTLQGVIAQTRPEILLDLVGHRQIVENAGIATDVTYMNDFQGLVNHFANRLSGYILCNTEDHSTNVAVSLCGIMNAIAVPVDIQSIATNAGLRLLMDVRGRDETWLLNNYGSSFSRKVASYQSCVDDRIQCMGDFSSFAKAIQFWDASATGPIATNVYGRLDNGATLLGWGPSEYETVEALSLRSMSIVPSDWASNLSTLMNIPPKRAEMKQKDPYFAYRSVDNVHTVCFVMTDGDNVQWLLGAHFNDVNNWLNPNRANIDLGWTISPSLVELAPPIYEKYLDNCLTTSTGRNLLIAGPSGKSYYMPGRMPAASLDNECTLLNRYMKRADLRIANIIDADNSNNDPTAYLKQDNIDALFYYSYGGNYTLRHGQIDWYKNKPSIGGRYTLWGTLSTPESLAATLNSSSTDIHSQDGYSLISVHVWDRGVNDVIDLKSRLGANVRVVPPDEFVWLVKKNIKGLPVGTGTGLKGQYYRGYNFDALQYEQTDRYVDFDWGAGSPNQALLGTDQFSIRWTGQVQPLYSETYTFYVGSDDGAKLTVNNQVLIDAFSTQGGTTRSGTIALTAGTKYNITLEYGEGAGNAYCDLQWESPSQLRETIPEIQLYPSGSCTSSTIVPYLQVNGGAWQNTSSASLAVGGSIILGPQPTDGSWKWTGPNNYTSSIREITLSNIQSNQSGAYVGTYTNPGGCSTSMTFNITVTGGCTPTIITPYLQINAGAWQSVNSISLAAGGSIILGPQPTDGTWKWTGPNNFTSAVREISITNIQSNQAGNYIGTYTNTAGCNSTVTFSITVTGGCTATTITPYLQINGGAWQSTTTANLSVGGTIILGPQPTDGTWKWSGPNGYTSSVREISIGNIQSNQAGNYVGTYTNTGGCNSSVTFAISVTGGCTKLAATGDFSTAVSNDANNPTLTFIPARAGVGSPTCILYYGTSATGDYTGYNATPNSPFRITANNGQTIYFYYTYTISAGVENNTYANRNSFTVGNCGSLKFAEVLPSISDDLAKDITIYPNPVIDIATFTTIPANSTITVIDLSGRELLKVKTPIETRDFKMDVSTLKSGVYFVKVENSETKIIKMMKN